VSSDKGKIANRLAITTIFPDAAAIFSHQVPPLEDVRDECDVVLDTNVLLLPYTTGGDSLKEISDVYKHLRRAQRLLVPGQVAREFARNRANRLTEIQRTLADRRSRVQRPQTTSYPLLRGLKDYEDLVALETAIAPQLTRYQDALGRVLDAVRNWGWNDPVSGLYREIFDDDAVVECSELHDAVIADLEHRIANKIPPGYKDANKDDDGVGDVLIWLTVLQIGRARKRPMLFVTADEKADWQHRVDNRGFLPRYELVDEYRRASDGRAFYISPFSKLLELFGASSDVVTEIRGQEDISTAAANCPYCDVQAIWRIGSFIGATSRVRCDACTLPFNIHRASDGAVVSRRVAGLTTDQGIPIEQPSIADLPQSDGFCPYCGEATTFSLASAAGSSSKPYCRACREWFHAHRRSDGSVIVRARGGAHG
jgi:uncharacterized protein (DUF983 family)/rRNA-processing protein FCF1